MKRAEDIEETARQRSVLATIDRALEGGGSPSGSRDAADRDADPAARELETLALALREELSVDPGPELTERLDRRVAEGFPRRRPAKPALRRGRRRSGGSEARGRERRRGWRMPDLCGLRPAPALAGVLSLLLVVVLVIPAAGTLQDDPETGGVPAPLSRAPGTPRDSLEESRDDEEPAEFTASQGRQSGSPGAEENIAPGRRDRRVERTGSLTLAAPGQRLEAVAADVVRIVDRHRGIVLSSSVSAGESGSGGGTFTLRIPVDDLSATMRELSALGEVRSRSQSGEDVTGSYLSVREQLAGYRAERRGLLRRLARSDSETEARGIRVRLRILDRAIGRLGTQARGLAERTDYAAVSVSLVSEDLDTDSGDSGTDIAFDDFVDSLVASLNIALRLLGVLIPLAVVLVPAVLAWRAWRRRSREAALGG